MGHHEVAHGVAADRAEGGVRDGDLTRVAEQEVQRERERRVDQDLVDVVQPDLHDRLLDPGQLGPQPRHRISAPQRQPGQVDDENDEDGGLRPPD